MEHSMSLKSARTTTLTPTLQSVKADFLNWRRDPHSPGRIPKALWDSVIQLLSHHGKSQVLSSLGISTRQLALQLQSRQKALKQQQNNPCTPLQPQHENKAFIKAVITQPMPSVACFDVLLTKPNGVQLHIQKLSHADMLKLAEQFTR